MKPDLRLSADLMAIVEQEYPRFSAQEMRRRRGLIEQSMHDAGVEHLLVYGSGFRGGAVHWACDWHTTYEAALVLTPGKPDTLFVQFYNHLPLARKMMAATDVRWAANRRSARSFRSSMHAGRVQTASA